VFIDLGIGTPEPCAFPPGLTRQAVTIGPAASRDALLAADRALDTRIVTSGLAALAAVSDEQVRVHRDGGQPVVGREASRQALKSAERPGAFTTIDGAVAGSGDLGYTYGKVEGTGEKPAYYVRVWRTGPTGAWRLTFDTMSR
jgi:ketosteroid isomerase-like protein